MLLLAVQMSVLANHRTRMIKGRPKLKFFVPPVLNLSDVSLKPTPKSCVTMAQSLIIKGMDGCKFCPQSTSTNNTINRLKNKSVIWCDSNLTVKPSISCHCPPPLSVSGSLKPVLTVFGQRQGVTLDNLPVINGPTKRDKQQPSTLVNSSLEVLSVKKFPANSLGG